MPRLYIGDCNIDVHRSPLHTCILSAELSRYPSTSATDLEVEKHAACNVASVGKFLASRFKHRRRAIEVAGAGKTVIFQSMRVCFICDRIIQNGESKL